MLPIIHQACSQKDFQQSRQKPYQTRIFTDRGVAETWNARRHRCGICFNATSSFTILSASRPSVDLSQEETEFRSDGTKKVLRPARLSLARVSVLRGSGPREGVPFIDDHIHTSEIIVDYLTEFSGIKCEFLVHVLKLNPTINPTGLVGDLDPVLSKYTLTPLKLVYKKLRLLVDSGCIFIGHGLSKDFRIISEIYVNPSSLLFSA